MGYVIQIIRVHNKYKMYGKGKGLNYITISHNGKDRRCIRVDGLFFYWFFWLGWVVTTFLYSKNHPDRLIVSAWILISVLLSIHSISIASMEWSGTAIWMLLTGYVYAAKMKAKQFFYFLISTFIVMLASVCFFLFELFDPIWIFLKREWLLAIIVTCITLLLQSNQKNRIIVTMLGVIQGEFLFAFILLKFSFPYPIGSLFSLDAMSLTFAVIITWNTLELITSGFERQFNSTEKEKQKIS